MVAAAGPVVVVVEDREVLVEVAFPEVEDPEVSDRLAGVLVLPAVVFQGVGGLEVLVLLGEVVALVPVVEEVVGRPFPEAGAAVVLQVVAGEEVADDEHPVFQFDCRAW